MKKQKQAKKYTKDMFLNYIHKVNRIYITNINQHSDYEHFIV